MMGKSVIIAAFVSFFVSVITTLGIYNFTKNKEGQVPVATEEVLNEGAPVLSLSEKVDTDAELLIDAPVAVTPAEDVPVATPVNEDEPVLEIQSEVVEEAEIPVEKIDEAASAAVEVELPEDGEAVEVPEPEAPKLEQLDEESLLIPADEEAVLLDEFDESVTPTTAPFEEVLPEILPENDSPLPELEEPAEESN